MTLIVILDDATSEIYYAQLVEEESTATVMAGLKEVIERKGVFCALYSDRGSHFWFDAEGGRQSGLPSPYAGGAGVAHRVGRADDPGLLTASAWAQRAQLPQPWQGRLPQELRLHQLRTLEAANRFLREDYIAEFNRCFQVAPRQRGNRLCALPES